jgi:hypothetical protein
MANIFNNCSSLTVDINSLIPRQGFLHKEINVENLFNSTAISGNVPANLLWNDSDITWKNTSNTFSNCSDEILAQVPVSWGGTNISIDAQLAITDEMKTDYTAFEVHPTITDIAAQSESDIINSITKEKITYRFTVAAGNTHKFIMRTTLPSFESDIIVDWGDGNVTEISKGVENSDFVYEHIDNSEYDYMLSHTYNVEDNSKN